MELHPIRSPARGDAVPEVLRKWLRAFRPHVAGPSWQNLLVLVMGARLAPGKRTVSACLRMTGRAEASNFTIYHQGLNRGRWKGRALARTRLDLVVGALGPEGPVIIGVDDTIERRWGARISARGI
jgi:DDE superfamily endonuclease